MQPAGSANIANASMGIKPFRYFFMAVSILLGQLFNDISYVPGIGTVLLELSYFTLVRDVFHDGQTVSLLTGKLNNSGLKIQWLRLET